MIILIKILRVVVIFLMLVSPKISYSQPSLSFFPFRVVIENKQRSDTIFITNRGTSRGKYKIEMVNKDMNKDGQTYSLKKKNKNGLYADEISLIRPRRVELEPGETQEVRILVRKKQNMPIGEYRSHIKFLNIVDSIENNLKNPELSQNSGIATSVSFSIPLIVRNGKTSALCSISDIKVKNKNITFNVYRLGSESLFGDVVVNYIDENNKEVSLVKSNGVAVYTTNEVRKFKFDIPKNIKLKKNNNIYVHYKERDGRGNLNKIMCKNKQIIL